MLCQSAVLIIVVHSSVFSCKNPEPSLANFSRRSSWELSLLSSKITPRARDAGWGYAFRPSQRSVLSCPLMGYCLCPWEEADGWVRCHHNWGFTQPLLWSVTPQCMEVGYATIPAQTLNAPTTLLGHGESMEWSWSQHVHFLLQNLAIIDGRNEILMQNLTCEEAWGMQSLAVQLLATMRHSWGCIKEITHIKVA